MVSILTINITVLKFTQDTIEGQKMSGITFQFDRQKAVESILYLVNRVSDSDIYGICKLLYLADKTSLEKYGRFIFGETYVAMVKGATPSNAYDVLKEVAQQPLNELVVDGVQVIARRDADLEFISDDTKTKIKQATSNAKTIAVRFRNLIING